MSIRIEEIPAFFKGYGVNVQIFCPIYRLDLSSGVGVIYAKV